MPLPRVISKKYSTGKTMSFNFDNGIYYQMETKKISLTGAYMYIYQTMYTISNEDFIPTELFHAFALYRY